VVIPSTVVVALLPAAVAAIPVCCSLARPSSRQSSPPSTRPLRLSASSSRSPPRLPLQEDPCPQLPPRQQQAPPSNAAPCARLKIRAQSCLNLSHRSRPLHVRSHPRRPSSTSSPGTASIFMWHLISRGRRLLHMSPRVFPFELLMVHYVMLPTRVLFQILILLSQIFSLYLTYQWIRYRWDKLQITITLLNLMTHLVLYRIGAQGV
jgi:hypothetical protein